MEMVTHLHRIFSYFISDPFLPQSVISSSEFWKMTGLKRTALVVGLLELSNMQPSEASIVLTNLKCACSVSLGKAVKKFTMLELC